jgi:hypothetical protein
VLNLGERIQSRKIFEHQGSDLLGVTDLDLAALGLDLPSLVEVGDHAEAAAAILDEGDGIAPPALRVLRRVLRRHLERLQELHRLVPEVRHDLDGRTDELINRCLTTGHVYMEQSPVRSAPPLQTSLCSVDA